MYSLIKLKIQIAGCQCDSDFTQNNYNIEICTRISHHLSTSCACDKCVATMKTNIVKYLFNPQMLLNTVIL